MAPILIDETGIKRLGIMAVIALMLSFVAGYYIGNQQSGIFGNAGTDVPQITSTDTTASTELQDSDKQKSVASASKAAPEKAPAKKSSAKVDDKAVSKKAITNRVTAAKTEKSETRSSKADGAGSVEQKSAEQEADGNHIKYSIQTAVYGQLNRAEKNMNELLDKNIEAYVTDSVNKSNKIWYNVRFGYFKDKKSALSALDDYKQTHGGDGYLVNFSAERIVDFDEQKFYEDSMELKPQQESVSGLQPSVDDSKPEELSVTNTNVQLR